MQHPDEHNTNPHLSRRRFIRNTAWTGAGLALGSTQLSAAAPLANHHVSTPADGIVADKLQYSDHVSMNGYIGKKLDLSYRNRILVQNANELVEPFRHRTETHLWQSEFWGKWFTSAVLAYRYRPEPELKKVLDNAVKGLLSTQTPEGYIGNYTKEHRLEQWDIWGMKYCLLGLLDYHAIMNDAASLQGAIKLADYLIKEINDRDGKIVNKGNYRGMVASSVLEPIVRLYNSTGNKKYLSFAEEIVRQWETPDGPGLISKASMNVSERFPPPKSWYSFEQGQKAYEMMSCYEGLLELYRVTGNNDYIEAAKKTWTNIRDTEINIAGSGASEEMWFKGKKRQTQPVTHFQETCVTATWIKFNQQLLRLTGDAQYADEIERSYYNALLGSLNRDASDWAKYTPLNGQRLPGSGQCGMNLNCCNASGPRGQFTLPLTAVMAMEKGLSVNFYESGYYKLKTPERNSVTLTQHTDYPVSGNIDMSLALATAANMTIRVRIPAWSKVNRLTVNGKEIPGIVPGKYVDINREWSSKDVIRLELDMRARVEWAGDENGKFAAITRGPVVLARDSRLEGPPLSTINRPVVDKDGYIELKPATLPHKDEYWMAYTAMFIPESYSETGAPPIPVQLIDYASAGNGEEKSTFQVWLAQLYSGRTNSSGG